MTIFIIGFAAGCFILYLLWLIVSFVWELIMSMF